MCSYNAVNGVPSCANDWLLGTVAREAWGFQGKNTHTHTYSRISQTEDFEGEGRLP